MSKLIFTLTTMFSLSAFSGPDFGAFVSGDNLVLTLLVDRCNAHSASLNLAKNCTKPFLTKDFVTTCEAEILVKSTERGCSDARVEAQTFEINIPKLNLRDTIDTLSLTKYTSESLEVALDSELQVSAFYTDKVLYFSLLGDTCNNISPSIYVNKFCDKDRLTRNLVIDCHAELGFLQTEKYCGPTIIPRTATINIEDTQIDPMAKKLVLDVEGTEIVVPLEDKR